MCRKHAPLSYPCRMQQPLARRRNPVFIFGTATLAIITLALMRLPETFVEQVRRNRPFDISQSGWIYRGMVFVAIAQAAYIGFVLLRVEKVQAARSRDPKLAQMGKPELMSSVARNAVGTALLTLVYGGSAFALTGERAGYWLFATLTVAQLAWYFLQCGRIAAWLEFQPEFVVQEGTHDPAPVTPDNENDHLPPLARGVVTSDES
jgi:hypothetical protein